MSETLQLRVVTPQATIFEGDVIGVSAPGAFGEFGVLPEHISYLTAVVPGPLRFDHAGKKQSYAIGRGFIQVSKDTVTVLCRYADQAVGIDKKQVESELEAAEKAFTQVGPRDNGFVAAEDRVLDARARLAVLA